MLGLCVIKEELACSSALAIPRGGPVPMSSLVHINWASKPADLPCHTAPFRVGPLSGAPSGGSRP